GLPQATVTITDAAPPTTTQFNAGNYPAREGDAYAELTFTLNQPYDVSVTVPYVTQDLSARAGADYVATGGSLTFLVGGSLSQTIRVPLLDDSLVEGDETFVVTLGGVPALLGLPNQAVVTIRDNDSAVPRVRFDSLTIPENAGTVQVRASLSRP